MAAVRLLRSVAKWRPSSAIRVRTPAYSRRFLSISSVLHFPDKVTHTGQVGLASYKLLIQLPPAPSVSVLDLV